MITGRPFRRHGTVSVVIILVLFAACTHPAFGQITSATISGTVKDQTNAVLPGVDVVVKNVSTGLTRTGVTDANGYFTLPGLPPGTYETRASLTGFGTAVERVTLAVAQEAGLTLTLAVTGTAESITLDGANMRGYAGTATVSAAETTLGVETIQEFRVVTNAYSADYGRAMGGVISLVTKSGTNTVHGSGFEFFRDSSLDARNFFDRGNDPPPFRRNQFGASFGGPIQKNRLFFFRGVERLQEDLGVTTS